MTRLPAPFSPWPPLLRAGAFGGLRGGHPGDPALGLEVPADSPRHLRAALEALAAGRAQATLLVPPDLATRAPADLRAATLAGHEIAGFGPPPELGGAGLALLEAAAGQPVTAWALDGAALSGAALRRLWSWGVAPLPGPVAEPQPGAVVRAWPAELGAFLPAVRALGYRPGPVRSLPELRAGTPRDLAAALYSAVVEDRYARQEGVIDLSQRADAVMRVAPLDHAPAPLPLPAGTPTAELHLNSARLVGLASRSLLGTYRAYQRSLKDVAVALRERPELAPAQAVFAVTLFHGPLEKSGFTLLELPPLRARWYGLGFRLVRAAYGTTRTPSEGQAWPKMAWMPRDAFLDRYG
ncbi:hypothetical protein [Deinococcus sp. Leaf326]|uniref:YkoP family protein n=1 Tax=Deinococcus sp. Leaf326 TaxID=1736338 RepID=UPI0006FEA34F|nr:hypothetical protein [Deinococcus sp. Leaf326]KQR27852.1 Sectered polysaccharide deacetylase [Deinococcus sp. Leaf326]